MFLEQTFVTFTLIKAIEDFTLVVGRLKPRSAGFQSLVQDARQIRAGDIILIRKDTRDEELKVDLQILSDYLGFLEDWKVFLYS